MGSRTAALAAFASLWAVSFVAAAEDPEKAETSRQISYATYSAESARVVVVVGTYLTGMDEQQKFAPMQIAVGLHGDGPSLLVTLDSFLLIDAAGNMYTTAEPGEVTARTSLITEADEMVTAEPLRSGEIFLNFHRVGSDFFTAEGVGDSRVPLDRDNYFSDLVWFAVPPGGFQGVLTLRVETDGMTEPVDVRFEVPEFKHRSKEKG